MRHFTSQSSPSLLILLSAVFFLACILIGDSPAQPLSDREWAEVDNSISRAVDWIATSQQPDGSFPTVMQGQPAITSFAVLAMMAQGEMPDEGKYGNSLAAAIDYVVSTQKPNGLLALVGPGGQFISPNVDHAISQTSVYNHAIAGLMLSEAYATTTSRRAEELQPVIENAIKVTLELQRSPKRRKIDRGGLRYLNRHSAQDADLSVIGWHLMFMRSAKNAGFDIPIEAIDDAVGCVRRHFSPEDRRFRYCPSHTSMSRGMTGAGILALAHAGLHDTFEARQASETLRIFSFTNYNLNERHLDRYHYSLFQCTQAAYQLGGENWEQFYPPTFRTLLANQNPDGSWDSESYGRGNGDSRYGSVYTSSLVVLALSAPNQLLPIFQR